ncbi:leucyl/phenylalanyl-tRNA--protein transferase [Flavobacterium silvaticum]|uniref:Leucyl/phenylalanyl-tRNA--protein transferase n=1 Tax=Flavobacterium silvaticum TaxID=1852020 RepID=A0A972FKT0_9FLAO|nr:leucyl/phenylalanyl-tRNA--protein transferase [Flavobacterium silvaticum]NMH27055.1 leucyl/phenylalanyl-tRNA--protein transferase [Flavobacterium silvaticum]
MYFLTKELYFPDPRETDKHGLLAVGGDLSLERLMLAYRSGIFPWFNEDEPILWWSPLKRMVLFFDEVKISKSMKKVIRNGGFTVTFNRDFPAVISNCRKSDRKGQDGTWITHEMEAAYNSLHASGFAKSVEVWQDEKLVGGLYGIDLGHIFCGESMFSLVPNASKIAFFALAAKLESEQYKLLDCQIHNPHLESLGCREISRGDFLRVVSG